MYPTLHPSLFFQVFRNARNTRTLFSGLVFAALILCSRDAAGQTWIQQTSPTPFGLNCVWGSAGNNVWAGGASGTLLKYDGFSWSSQSDGTNVNITSIGGVNASNIWVSHTNNMRYFNGSSWSTATSYLPNSSLDVWAYNTSNIWYVGNSGTILKYDGSIWSAQTSNAFLNLRSVWGADPYNVWAVGNGGTIVKYDGATWTPQPSSTTDNLYGVWGTDATHVWAVGSNGVILKYNGIFWTQETNPFGSIQLNSIWGTDANNVWAVGASGRILKYNGFSWNLENFNSLTNLNGVWGNSTGMWAVGTGGVILYQSLGTLPVEMTDFQARLQSDQSVQLHWQTASEKDNAGFDIERSADGKTWGKIGFVAGQGDAQVKTTYQFADPQPLHGHNYYRLAQVDLNGKKNYSAIKNVVLAGAANADIHIFPNPVRQGAFTLQLAEEPDDEARLRIYSSAGQLLLDEPVASSVHRADLSGWAPGVYLLEMDNAGVTRQERLVVAQ